MRLTLHAFLSLDGVVQAPGGPGEDDDGGFAFGGWSFPHGDEAFGSAMGGWLAQAGAFLLGRRTYEIFAAHWPRVTDEADAIATALNSLPKHVASRTRSSLEWAHSSLLGPDVVGAVQRLKAQGGGELQVHGSGGLAQTLIASDLVDEYRLMWFPVHLGQGKRLFRDGTPAGALRLVGSSTTPAGVAITTYVPDGPVRTGSYRLDAD